MIPKEPLGFAVAVLGGRRVDPPGARLERFPPTAISSVREDLRELLLEERIGLLISSAAAGADLLGLDVALKIGIRCDVVLPFEILQFRIRSVMDRGAFWGDLFDSVIARVGSGVTLKILNLSSDDEQQAYRATNEELIREATLKSFGSALSIIVWEGESRGSDDLTAHLQALARGAGMKERVINTCER